MSIKFENVSYIYSPGTPFEKKALNQVSFDLTEKKFVAIVGHTGSGKSTLMQHFNALLKPSAGQIEIAGYKITPETSNKGLKPLRKKVSLSFQFPESQLFETTVVNDIAYGPKNFGFSEAESNKLAKEWLSRVGLPKDIADRSPFELSGGQMRKVALAGVMAYEPEILCLDEPAAGLDPSAHREMMKLFKEYQKSGKTVILVTHNMDDVAEYADEVLVMEHGNLLKHTTPRELFSDPNWLVEHSLNLPKSAEFANKLKNFHFEKTPLTPEELSVQIIKQLKR